MHYVLLTRLPTDPDTCSDALERIAGAGFPVAVVMPHPAPVESVPEMPSDRVEWIRTGYSEPWFPLLPESEIARQISREVAALSDLGVSHPGPLMVTGPWATHLPLALRRVGVDALLINADLLDHPAPGVVAHLDAVLPVVPVSDPSIFESETSPSDHCVVIEVDPHELEDAARWIARRPGADLTTVGAFLAVHRPSGRRRPTIDDWGARFAGDPDRFVLHRKLVRLVTRVPERLSPAAEAAVLKAERATGFAGGQMTPAHEAIIEARVAIDAERRRGDDWWKVSRLDWDADGGTEIHIQLPDVSFVVAPHRSSAVPTFDLKHPVWAASAISGEPGWTLCRFSSDLEGMEATPFEMTEVRTTEVRGATVELELAGPIGAGTLALTVVAHGRQLRLTYEMDGVPVGRIGPELKFAFDPEARVRVDGSEWSSMTEPAALAGHKIRIADERHQVVLSSLTPLSVFGRPGVDGSGLVVWPHWATDGGGTHELTVDLAPPVRDDS
jgi:hypothetical protein